MRAMAAFHLSTSLQNLVDSVANFVPKLVAAILILIIGRIIAGIIRRVIVKLLTKLGVDKVLKTHELQGITKRLGPNFSLAKVIGTTLYIFIIVFVVIAAISVLNIGPLNDFMRRVENYMPNIIAALIILAAAVFLSGAVGGLAMRAAGDTGTGKTVAAVVPTVIMVIAAFMILEQLKIAPAIVQLTFEATVFALALGFALAFGLGGRNVAERILENGYEKAQAAGTQIKSDVDLVRSRGADGLKPGGGRTDATPPSTEV